MQFTGKEERRFDDLLATVAGRVIDNQVCLEQRIHGAPWTIDNDAGILSFTLPSRKKLKFPVQYVGSYSRESRTWAWASNNPALRVPSETLNACRTFVSYAKKDGLASLTKNKFKIGDGTDSNFTYWDVAYAVGGVADHPVFSCPAHAGELLVLVESDDVRGKRGIELDEFETRFNKATIAMTFTNQRKALKVYAELHGLKVAETADEIEVRKGRKATSFHFDGTCLGRKFTSEESLKRFFDEF